MSAKAQSSTTRFWTEGSYYDLKGNKFTGLICKQGDVKYSFAEQTNAIYFRSSEKDAEHRITVDSIKAYVILADSFVVSHAVGARHGLFLRVIINEPVKLFELKEMVNNQPPAMVYTPTSRGGVSTTFAVGLPLTNTQQRISYFYGNTPEDLAPLKKAHFWDAMDKILAAKPALIEEIKYQKYNYKDLDEIISYYNWSKRHESATGVKAN